MQQLIDVQHESEVGKTSYGHVRENGGKMHCTEHHLAWTVSKQKFIAHAQLLPCFFTYVVSGGLLTSHCARRCWCWLTMHRAAVNAHNITLR